MAIDRNLCTGKQHKVSSKNDDQRRRWPLPDLQVGDWFVFPVDRLATIRSCAHAFRNRNAGVSFSIGKDPNSSANGVCIRLS
jgi:hypothetical protein